MKRLRCLLMIGVLALSACRPSPTMEPATQITPDPPTNTPQPTKPPVTPTPQPKLDELVMAAMAGWNSDDISSDQIDVTIAYFADDAVFKMIGFPPTVPSEFQGKEAIRAAFESWMPLHPKLEVIVEGVDGNTVSATTSYWSDPMRALKVVPLVGKDVYVFEGEKIINETWTLDEDTQNKLAAAMAAPVTPTPSPEALAASFDELVGTWKGRWSDATSIYFEVKQGGLSRTYFPNGDLINMVTLTFENGKLTFPSLGTGAAVAKICEENPVAEYMVYVTKQGEQTIKLRFELIGEDHCGDRKEFLNGRTLKPVNP